MKKAYVKPGRVTAAVIANLAALPALEAAAGGEALRGSVTGLPLALITSVACRSTEEAPAITRRRAAWIAGSVALGMNVANTALEFKTGAGFLPVGIEDFNPFNAYISTLSAGITATAAALAYSEKEVPQPPVG